MQRTDNLKRVDLNGNYINNEVDYSIVLTEEEIEAVKEAEREIERGEGIELKEGMTILDLIKDWSEDDR